MLQRTIAIVLALSLLIPGFALVAAAAEKQLDTVTLELPRGSPSAGRAVFLRKQCTRCHRVTAEPDFPSPSSVTPGPTLGTYQGGKSPAELAMSVFSPSHEISGTLRGPHEDGKSPMPDFTRAITVREFMDVIAFLDSLDGK